MADKNKPLSRYRSYLLRFWLEDARSKFPWKITLINPQTGERRGFVDFDRFVDYLREKVLDDRGHIPREMDDRSS
jgi:hypothetical protein